MCSETCYPPTRNAPLVCSHHATPHTLDGVKIPCEPNPKRRRPPVGNSNSSEFEEVNGLLVDILGVAMETGPSGVARSLSAAQACASLAATLIVSSQNPQPKPEELLRRVFEALGSTYIKLGQFIASSPTLFLKSTSKSFKTVLTEPRQFLLQRFATSSAQTSASPVESVFESIDPVPLASASVGPSARSCIAWESQGGCR